MNTSPVTPNPQVAFIREAECIGCTKCLHACPVDAIVGATRHLHTVIATDCTGCALCITPCPMDCIELRPTTQTVDPAQTEQRVIRRQQRLAQRIEEQPTEAAPQLKPAVAAPPTADTNPLEEEHKKLRMAVHKTRIALTKAEQQFKRRQTPLLAEQIQRLQVALQQAEDRLQQALRPSEPLPQAQEPKDALHQAKLHLVAQRTALKHAEHAQLPEAELLKLRTQVQLAETALHEAEAQTQRPTPQRALTTLNPLPIAIRDLKTELALARAALSRESRRQPPDTDRLAQSTAKVQELEEQLATVSSPNAPPKPSI